MIVHTTALVGTDCFLGAALQDLYSFCGVALLTQLAFLLLFVSRVAQHPHSSETIVRHFAEALIRAVPTTVPTVIVFSLFCCVIKLLRHRIHVHQHTKVKLAADVEVAVFDKTGTLTGSVVSPSTLNLHWQCGEP